MPGGGITFRRNTAKFWNLCRYEHSGAWKALMSRISEPVLETVNQLIENHGVSLRAKTIVHSDQGCHYTSYSFINILKDKKLRQSMSRKGNCWDNAPQESFHGHMKDHISEKVAACTEFL